jgi:histidyl-tRNA synthetase
MADIPYPRGVRDLMPNEALFRAELVKKAESVFQRFGFLTIDTPAFESLKVLMAKNAIGEDNTLIYEIKDEDLGLRYDHTVSFARYVGMHQELPLPFKRYCIGKVWRKDEPQKNRYREFMQADIDIAGGTPSFCDAEVVAAIATALDEMGINYTIKLNNRRIVDDLLLGSGLTPEVSRNAMRAIDKTDKIGAEKVNELLLALGIGKDLLEHINSFIRMEGGTEEKLSYAESVVKDKAAVAELRTVMELLAKYNVRGSFKVDFSLVRGLDYYTGLVFEVVDASGAIGASIGAGGRYNKLISLYGPREIEAVGASLGIDRILDLMDYSSSVQYTFANTFVAYINESNYPYALEIANGLRKNGVNAEINLTKRNISNQLSYANSLKFKFALIVGGSEEKEHKVKLRNLVSGEEVTLGFDEALAIVKKG